MQFLGGKATLGKKIAAIIEAERLPGQDYYEPFMGGLNVIRHVSGVRHGSDGHEGLFELYASWREGWRPPAVITEEMYVDLKRRQDLTDPLTTFVGFGVSYGGKWFGGLARDPTSGRDFVGTASRGLDAKLRDCADATLGHADYRDIRPTNAIVYADPPYAKGTQAYGAAMRFDSDEFWSWARDVSADNALLVSEYEAPSDFECIAEFPVRKSRFTGAQVERLFRFRR